MANRNITCTNCGKTIDLDYYHRNKSLVKQMRDETLCFECSYWKHVLDNPTPNTYIISGGLYRMIPIYNVSRQNTLCKKGMKLLQDLKTGKVLCSEDYRLYAKVPKAFKNQLPDRYRFITYDTYMKILSYQGTNCMLKGCFDRYHCYWYNALLSEPEGPWNKIPPTYKIGNEGCESFINKETMYDIGE